MRRRASDESVRLAARRTLAPHPPTLVRVRGAVLLGALVGGVLGASGAIPVRRRFGSDRSRCGECPRRIRCPDGRGAAAGPAGQSRRRPGRHRRSDRRHVLGQLHGAYGDGGAGGGVRRLARPRVRRGLDRFTALATEPLTAQIDAGIVQLDTTLESLEQSANDGLEQFADVGNNDAAIALLVGQQGDIRQDIVDASSSVAGWSRSATTSQQSRGSRRPGRHCADGHQAHVRRGCGSRRSPCPARWCCMGPVRPSGAACDARQAGGAGCPVLGLMDTAEIDASLVWLCALRRAGGVEQAGGLRNRPNRSRPSLPRRRPHTGDAGRGDRRRCLGARRGRRPAGPARLCGAGAAPRKTRCRRLRPTSGAPAPTTSRRLRPDGRAERDRDWAAAGTVGDA